LYLLIRLTLSIFFFYFYVPHSYLHSFPTRRSSDLPASWKLATNARDESKGMIEFVTDDEITRAFKTLPAKEGVFAEPGSCASIAGVFQQVKAGTIPKGSKVVAVLTGNGLKDPQTAVDQIDVEVTSLPNDETAVTNYIKSMVEQ